MSNFVVLASSLARLGYYVDEPPPESGLSLPTRIVIWLVVSGIGLIISYWVIRLAVKAAVRGLEEQAKRQRELLEGHAAQIHQLIKLEREERGLPTHTPGDDAKPTAWERMGTS